MRSFIFTSSRIVFLCGGLMLSLLWLPQPVDAQLTRDVREVFAGMLDSLDDELRQKFEQAIEDGTDRIEFTPEQFLRFRRNPANPFEGLDRIPARPGGENIALRFELASLRKRAVHPLERQHRSLLSSLEGQSLAAGKSTAAIYIGSEQVALGTVVSNRGHILTKASELKSGESIECRLPGLAPRVARQLQVDEANDLALLKIDRATTTPITWSKVEPELGAFLLSPGGDGKLMALGTYSVAPRSLSEGERAFLGVLPVTADRGVSVSEIRPGTASFESGLRDGDVIVQLGRQVITDVSSLVNTIRAYRPGDKVSIEFLRKGEKITTTATLDGLKVTAERAARFKMMNRLGTVPSNRSSNFQSVFQHDTPLFPEQCGGPIVNLDGELVGINIARQGRASSLALPADQVRAWVGQWELD